MEELIRRIIPTRVGTRVVKGFKVFTPEDHPHACGDKGSRYIGGDTPLGSSPRVWGQVKKCESSALAERIIPTRVGTSYNITH